MKFGEDIDFEVHLAPGAGKYPDSADFVDISDIVTRINPNRRINKWTGEAETGTLNIEFDNSDHDIDLDLLDKSDKVIVTAKYGENERNLFTGYLQDWDYEPSPPLNFASVSMQFMDRLGFAANISLKDEFEDMILGKSPVAYWPMSDVHGRRELQNETDYDRDLTLRVTGRMMTGQPSWTVGGASRSKYFVEPAVHERPRGLRILGQLGIGFKIRLHPTASPSGDRFVVTWNNGRVPYGVQMHTNGVTFFQTDLANNSDSLFAGFDFTDNEWHTVIINRRSTRYVVIYIDGNLIEQGPLNVPGTNFGTENFLVGPNLAGWLSDLFIFDRPLHSGDIETIENVDIDVFGREWSHKRVKRLADYLDIDHDVAQGSIYCAVESPNNASLLQYLNRITRSENGIMFVTGDDTLTWRGLSSLSMSEPQFAISTVEGNGIETDGMSIEYDEAIVNQITVQSPDDDEEAIANDTDSQNRYGRFDETFSHVSVGYRWLQSWARRMLRFRAEPKHRITAFRLRPAFDEPDKWQLAIETEIGDKLNTELSIVGEVGVYQGSGHIIGVEHDITTDSWISSFSVGKEHEDVYWILGDEDRSVLGETTRLN